MTMRRVSELDHAFNRHDIGRFFAANRRYCLNNNYTKTNDVRDKTLLMAKAAKELPSGCRYLDGGGYGSGYCRR
jgi:hypothetical protein